MALDSTGKARSLKKRALLHAAFISEVASGSGKGEKWFTRHGGAARDAPDQPGKSSWPKEAYASAASLHDAVDQAAYNLTHYGNRRRPDTGSASAGLMVLPDGVLIEVFVVCELFEPPRRYKPRQTKKD